MKKAGILTFHKSINYGSVLQAYALLQTIIKIGNPVEIIDYQQKNYKYLYGILRKPCSLDNIKYNLINCCFLKALLTRKKNFENFRKKYLHLSDKRYEYGGNLEDIVRAYDVLICGSDQIWNPDAKDFDINFFLPFARRAQKISYAVSINGGILDTLDNKEELKDYLMDFDRISVRERSGKESLSSFLSEKKEISVVLDPTLLWKKEEYDKICSSRLIKEPYIFFYSVNFSDYAVKAAEILSDRLELPVYTLYTGRSSAKVMLTRKKIHFCLKTSSPEDFLSLIRNAEFVVTNSFHGTAFSLIYEKKFYSIGRVDGDKKLIPDERICNVLELFGIPGRFISCGELKTVSLKQEINYSAVNVRRQKLAEESRNYIMRALNEK